MIKPKKNDLRAWWIPQVPMDAFYVPVATPDEAVKILAVLADYDTFQLENNVKGDYCNAGGLQYFDSDDGDWFDWYEEETGDDIDAYAERKADAVTQLGEVK